MANKDCINELGRQRAVFSMDTLFLLLDHVGVNRQKDGINWGSGL